MTMMAASTEEEENAEWYSELERPESFYSDAAQYWEAVPSTVDGMLGGFGALSTLDTAGSKKFLSPFIEGLSAWVHPGRALDCGAGIGRVSKRLLLPLFSEVDLLEQNPAFLEKARTFLGPSASRVGHYFAMGMQDFTPQSGRYDVIWIQWVIGHLTDDDLTSFLQRCAEGLNPSGGIIVIKDNISTTDTFDSHDSSVTRCTASVLRLVGRAGLALIKEEAQSNFPSSLFEVKTFAIGRPQH